MKKYLTSTVIISTIVANNISVINAYEINKNLTIQEQQNINLEEINKTEVNEIYINSLIDNCRILVSQFYKGFHQREADQSGLEYWANQIANKNKTVADVVDSFINSKEFIEKNNSDEDYIKCIYISILGRTADTSGLNYWLEQLELGYSKKYILYNIFNSIEFKSKLDNMKIENIGSIILDSIDNETVVRKLVDQFYKGLYKREGDDNGLNYWSEEIVSGRKTVAQVLESFINSNEFENKNYSNEEYIKCIYISMYSKEINKEELKYWTEHLNVGQSRKYVLANIFNSQEFQRKLDNINIKNKGEIILTLQDSMGKVKGLVNQFYKGLYNREADISGLNYWYTNIINNEISISSMLELFISNTEYKNKNYSNEQKVNSIYRALFGRDATKDELSSGKILLDKGNSLRFILSNNINSYEFNNILNNIGITNKGEIIIELDDRKGEVSDIVNNLYLGLYGRNAEQSGKNYWTDEIINKRRTVAQVVESFISSNEFMNKKYSGEEYVKSVYKSILGRDADIDGLNYWLNELINGKSYKYIVKSIFESYENKNKLESIGIINNIGEIKLSKNEMQSTEAKAIINVSSINLRKDISLQSDILTTISRGEKVVVVGRVKGDITYYKVNYVQNGKIYNGYISIYVSGVNSIEIFEDNNRNEFLGVLSEKYESNGEPGLIANNPGDYGGKSYGAWQFSENMGSLDGFVNWLKDKNYNFYIKLKDAKLLDGGICGINFDNTWKDIAKNNYNTFYNLQQGYVKTNFYDKLVRELLKVDDFSNILSNFAARNVLWSTVVQHGVSGASRIIKPLKDIENVDEFINAVYKERGRRNSDGKLVHFISSSQAIQESVASRFKRENEQALKIHGYILNN